MKRAEPHAPAPPPWTRLDDALRALCALLPATLAASGAASAAPASHDEGVVRSVGLGFTGLFRGLDALASGLPMLVPVGSRALRAGLASALVVGVVGAVAYGAARALLAAVPRSASAPRLASVVAALSVLSALLGPLWQSEASAPAGSVTGAALVVAAVAIGQRAHAARDVRGLPGLALCLGLAASYEPLVLLATFLAAAPWLFGLVRLPGAKGVTVDAALAFLLGLAPLGVAAALLRRPPEIAVAGARLLASPLGEQAGARVAPGPWALSELGTVLLVLAAAGAVLAAVRSGERARLFLASLCGVMVAGAASLLLGAPSSQGHVTGALLAATLAAYVMAGVALAAAVVAIRAVKVPFAHASAALVVVLELVLPVRAADETAARREERATGGTLVWNEVAWGAAPAAAVLVVARPGSMRRIDAARATGDLRADLLVVPTFALPSRVTDRALAAEPKLAPLYRDVTLGNPPEELSLAQLASQRPVLAEFEPTWDRNLARHFVPVGLTSRFEPEPRGSSDRKRALDAFAPSKDRLARVATPKRDPELAFATARLLRGRAVTIAASGEREILARALDDLRPFAPDDEVANALVRRTVTSRGAIEVKDLRP
ncbi:MAG: hypothetical protein JWP97_1382 [Labilithrix sp.]|nr:hypothetical protein [Labilithrix sp.]